MEAGGHIYRTAKLSGFAGSTVSKYAKKKGWDEGIQRVGGNGPKQEKDGENSGTAEQVMSKLKELRKLIFEEVMGNEKTETVGESLLKIPPRTLAEVVKALIDVDKRISEREEPQLNTVLDAYREILINCARIVEDEQG